MHSAQVICDSVSPAGHRLTTMIVTMPRIVLADFNTHRLISKPDTRDETFWGEFSRNGASSRAIPAKRIIEMVKSNPYVPTHWGKNQPGMMPSDDEVAEKDKAEFAWRQGLHQALSLAAYLDELGCHKEIVSAPLLPYMWQTMLVTATEWDGFFDQRGEGSGARRDLRIVAEKMRDALAASEPVERSVHVPFSADESSPLSSRHCLEDWCLESWGRERCEKIIRVAIARCARLSYLTHDGEYDIDADLGLYDRLRNARPPHASPFEHVAWAGDGKRNFRGWIQERERLGI